MGHQPWAPDGRLGRKLVSLAQFTDWGPWPTAHGQVLMTAWQLTGSLAPASLAPARRELHAAVQLIAGAGSLLPPRADDSHTSMSWHDGSGFVGEPLSGEGMRVGLEPAKLVLWVLDTDLHPVDELRLGGRTLADARHWLGGALTGRVATRKAIGSIELPEALSAERKADAAFVEHVEAVELAAYYANANLLLARRASAGSPVRCWPHHMDIAVLLAGPHDGQTIGVGMSPGDSSYNEPYWYVTPWPHSGDFASQPLTGAGTWHSGNWVGAVLPSSRVRRHDAMTQYTQVSAFVASAIAASRWVLKQVGG